MPRKTKWPEATIGEHLYEPIAIAQLHRKGFDCFRTEQKRARYVIPPECASPEALANEPKVQQFCKEYVEEGFLPVFEPEIRKIIIYLPERSRRRQRANAKKFPMRR